MSPTLEKSLFTIAKNLNKTGANWALTGEGALKIWGVDISPKSFNIVITESLHQGLEKIKYNNILFPVNSLDIELKNNKNHSLLIKKRIKELQANDLYGYVQVDIDKSCKQLLHRVVSKCVDQGLLFNSKSVSYIKGNVCSKAHITICYGINNSDLHEKFKKSKQRLQNINYVKISKIDYWSGFDNEYQLIIAVPEPNAQLNKFDRWIRKNNDISKSSLSFEPHISLCYIKQPSKNSLDEIILELSKQLVGKKIKCEGINFFKPHTEQKVNLINL